MKKALFVGATSLALVAGTISTAQAAPRPVDITGYSVKDVVFDRAGCQRVPVKVKARIDKTVDRESLSAIVELARGKYIYTDEGYAFTDGSSGEALICDDDGYGKIKVGPAEVDGMLKNSEDEFYSKDKTTSSFHVRVKAKAALNAKRSGSKVVLTASASRFNEHTDAYKAYSPKKAKIQVKSGTKWKTVKTVDLKKGKATYTVKRKSKASYRLTFDQVTWATGATSKSVKK
ncbi:hypothetical protein LWF01_05490 [Saxibacter everestensis]|uniref:Uncharacterized protein n=1 Tax=Saxibacter everestensis TaxID=2909229 RepID=A0ABY8QWM8_9MICO|nr:hypothetical protein LWF01_05490 [Brevibacteriaceae bacterium ZFBP1038]